MCHVRCSVLEETAAREKLACKVARANYMHAEAQQGDVIAALQDEVRTRDEQMRSLQTNLAKFQGCRAHGGEEAVS
jgi:hypothetical protein